MCSYLRLVKGIDIDAMSESDRRETVAVANVALSNGWSL